jgi:hypothetical protein
VPAFYRYLQAQDTAAQIEGGKEFVAALDQLSKLLERGEKETEFHAMGGGLWREGGEINLLDAMAGPCALLQSLGYFCYSHILVQGFSARQMSFFTIEALRCPWAPSLTLGSRSLSNTRPSKALVARRSCTWKAMKGAFLLAVRRSPTEAHSDMRTTDQTRAKLRMRSTWATHFLEELLLLSYGLQRLNWVGPSDANGVFNTIPCLHICLHLRSNNTVVFLDTIIL